MNISIAEFVILTFAVWRVTALVVHDKGPMGSFVKARDRIGRYYDEHSRCRGRNIFADAICCTWCSSIWIALGFSFVVYWYQGIATILLMTLALSGSAILVDEYIDG